MSSNTLDKPGILYFGGPGAPLDLGGKESPSDISLQAPPCVVQAALGDPVD